MTYQGLLSALDGLKDEEREAIHEAAHLASRNRVSRGGIGQTAQDWDRWTRQWESLSPEAKRLCDAATELWPSIVAEARAEYAKACGEEEAETAPYSALFDPKDPVWDIYEAAWAASGGPCFPVPDSY